MRFTGTLKIYIMSTNVRSLDSIVSRILDIAKRHGLKVKGPIPLPTKKIRVVTRKSPCGNGTETWDKWELRLHKRLLYVQTTPRASKELIHVYIPPDTRIHMEKA